MLPHLFLPTLSFYKKFYLGLCIRFEKSFININYINFCSRPAQPVISNILTSEWFSGPLLRALLLTDRKALLYGEKQRNDLMPYQFSVKIVAALKYFSLLTCKRYALIVDL